MDAVAIDRVEVRIARREDGGLRAWSDALPELVLSHADAVQVLADLPDALEVVLSDRLGGAVRVEEVGASPSRRELRRAKRDA